MTIVLESLGLILGVVLLVIMVRIALDLRVIRNQLLPDIRASLLRGSYGRELLNEPVRMARHGNIPVPHSVPAGQGSFLFWEWVEGQWNCRSEHVADLRVLPPSHPGAFEGDITKTWVSMYR